MKRWLSLAGIVLLTASGIAMAGPEDSAKGQGADAEAKPVAKAEVARAKMLDRVTVVGPPGRPGEIPGSVHRMTLQQLDGQNQAFDDIHRILFRVPGINIQEEEGFGLRPNIGMRGTGSDRSANITLMEDGILMAPAPYAAPAAYYFPYVGRMEGIEVRKGSSQIKYGPRTNGGALNLLSSSMTDRLSSRARVAAGTNNTQKIYANYSDTWRNVSWLFETYRMQSDGFKTLDGGGSTGFDVQDYVGKLRVRTGPEARVYQEATVKLGYNEENSASTYLGLTEADFAGTPYRRYSASQRDAMTAEHSEAHIRYFIMPSENVDLTATVYRSDFERNWYKLDKVSGTSISTILDDPAAYAGEYGIITGDSTSADDALGVKANNRDYFSHGVESIVGLALSAGGSRHELEIGARYHEDEEDRFQHTDRYRMDAGGTMVLTTKGVPGAAGGGDNRVNSARAIALFVQDNISWGRWTVTPGLRYETIETRREQYAAGDPQRAGAATVTENTTDVLVPGVGVNLQFDERFAMFGGVHKGFAPPGPGANDSTEAETSVNYELGLRCAVRRGGAQVLGFFNDYDNLLGKDTFASGGTGSGDLFNGGGVEVYGLEASLYGDLGGSPTYSIPVSLAYTYTVSEFKSSFVSDYEPWGVVERGDGMPYVPAHQLSASIAYDRSKWRLNLFGNYVGRMRTSAGQGPIPAGEGTDARFIVDATAEYSIARSTRAFVSVLNATDDVYIVARRPAGVRPGISRQVMAGIKIDI